MRELKIEEIPTEILQALKGARPEFSEDEILQMTPKEMFNYYCIWNGLIRWGDTLWDRVSELKALEERVRK